MSEELKLAIEAFQNLGTQGVDAFVWWLVVTNVTKLLNTIIVAVPFCVGFVMMKRVIITLATTED